MILISAKNFYLPHRKEAADSRTKKLETPRTVVICMGQGMGAPCETKVKIGERVKTGQLIGDSEAFVSAPIYSSATGIVTEKRQLREINGTLNKAVVIETEINHEYCPEIAPPKIADRADFLKAVRKSGLVGLGGAGFPSHVKLGFDREKFNIDTLIINAAECEPYVTTDHCEIMENPADIIKGTKLIMQYCSIPNAFIAIEKSNPIAIKLMREHSANDTNINVSILKTNYPQGAEKVLIKSVTGRVVKEGQLPLSAGCLIVNISSAAFIARYVQTGIPLISRRVTIDGNIVNKPANLMTPVGMTLGDLIKKVDLRKQPDRIVFGGPMMGRSVYDFDTPVLKTTGAVLFFKDLPYNKQTVCIRCGKCFRACFMRLLPTEIERAHATKDLKLLQKLKVTSCMECGSCSYICPSKRNLTETNRLAKELLKGVDKN
ncbi:MAG: RnfABCDGE type electron transport complex subunit C [Oscillospiraceae bacterium]|nr:RnfABCDGE type electron transport complex subunit C [Oscillospiraceae bacterium]